MIKLIESYRDFLSLKDEWNDLLDNSEEQDNIFLRHEWFGVWWQAFGANRYLFILLYYEDSVLLGISPLMIFRDVYKKTPYKRLGFIEDPNAPSMNFIVVKGYEKRVICGFLEYLLNTKKRFWHVAVLNKISDTSPTITICKNFLSQNSAKYLIRESQNSPYIPVNSDYHAFLNTTSNKFRKQQRYKFNKLKKAGKVEFEVWQDVGAESLHLSEAMRVSSKSWKHNEGTSMTSTPERKIFFTRLSDIAGQHGWLRIWLLSLNGEPIAMEYHLEYKGKTHAMRGDFDESFNYLSPGSVLEAHIIKHCFENKLLEYDFCGLPYGYKVRWTKYLHERSNLLFYNQNPYSKLMYIEQKYLPIIRKRCLKFMRLPTLKGNTF